MVMLIGKTSKIRYYNIHIGKGGKFGLNIQKQL